MCIWLFCDLHSVILGSLVFMHYRYVQNVYKCVLFQCPAFYCHNYKVGNSVVVAAYILNKNLRLSILLHLVVTALCLESLCMCFSTLKQCICVYAAVLQLEWGITEKIMEPHQGSVAVCWASNPRHLPLSLWAFLSLCLSPSPYGDIFPGCVSPWMTTRGSLECMSAEWPGRKR